MLSNKERYDMTSNEYNDNIIDLTYWSGEDLYSDGPIEDEILDFLRNNPPSEYEKFIQKSRNWAVMYHLSHIRQNILMSVGINKNDTVLEIGAGMGAITGKLCELAKSVTCVELSKKRSEINACRNRDFKNIRILVGNFQTIEGHLNEKFDVVTLIGVFEYGSSYIDTNEPYKDFLKISLKHLKTGGRLYIAIENRLGLKYFAGCREDHVGRNFEGIEGYTLTKRAVTFSREEFENLFAECGIKDYRFMYPYPDYKFPMQIFSDDWLPKNGDLTMNLMNMDQSRYMFFDETKAYDSFVKTDYFKTFSNSFLIEIIKR